MIKPISITAAVALALGSILGYWLQKLESQPIAKQDSGEAIAAVPKQAKQVNLKPTDKRSELEAKYFLCTNTSKESVNLTRFSDKQLNDLVYNVCTEAS